MGSMLSAPVELVRVQRHGSGAFRCGVAEMHGWRSSHEDAHDVHCSATAGAFWVLDGHGGDQASLVGAPKLGEEFAPLVKKGKMPEDARIEKGLTDVDAHLRAAIKESGSTVVGAIAVKEQSGTYTLKMINCGDSRGIVVRSHKEEESAPSDVTTRAPQHLVDLLEDPRAVEKGDAIKEASWPLVQETVDHKPSHPTEKARIEAAGGHVTNDEPPRLDGNLAVSRGLGDFEYKGSSDLPVQEQKVSCIPDVYEVQGLSEGSLCVLCCDGVWDVMSGEDVGKLAHEALVADANADLGEIAARIINISHERNSRDNITAMVVHLAPGTEWAESPPPDEMKGFEKLNGTNGAEVIADEEVKNKYKGFLRRCGFPPEPIGCEVCGKWYVNMMQCPCKKVNYCNKLCQKKGWKKHKPFCPTANPTTPGSGSSKGKK